MPKPSNKRFTKAYCWRTGKIEFGMDVPRGAIFIMPVKTQKVRDQIEVLAQRAKNNEDSYIRGVGETKDDAIALKEVQYFRSCVEWALLPKEKRGPKWPPRDFENPDRF